MKKTVFVGIIGCASLVFASSVLLQKNELLIQVGNEKIKKEEFYTNLKVNYGEEVMRNMVIEKILFQNVSVSEKEINKKIDSLIIVHGVKNKAQLKQVLNLNEKKLIQKVKMEIAELKFLKEKANITDEEIKQELLNKSQQLVYNSVIVDTKEEADKIKTLVKEGKNLERASEKSMSNYHLKFHWKESVLLSSLPSEITNAIFGLQVGEVSEVVNVNGKYEIFEILEYKSLEEEFIEKEIVLNIAEKKGITLSSLYDEFLKENKVKIKDEDFKSLIGGI